MLKIALDNHQGQCQNPSSSKRKSFDQKRNLEPIMITKKDHPKPRECAGYELMPRDLRALSVIKLVEPR